MPLFDFRCRACQTRFERLVRVADRPGEVSCPHCQCLEVERMLSAPARGGGARTQTAGCKPRGGFT